MFNTWELSFFYLKLDEYPPPLKNVDRGCVAQLEVGGGELKSLVYKCLNSHGNVADK